MTVWWIAAPMGVMFAAWLATAMMRFDNPTIYLAVTSTVSAWIAATGAALIIWVKR